MPPFVTLLIFKLKDKNKRLVYIFEYFTEILKLYPILFLK